MKIFHFRIDFMQGCICGGFWGPLLTYINLLLLFLCFDQSLLFYTIKLIAFHHKINSSTPDYKENQFAPFTISHIYVFPTRFNLENIMNLNQRAINWINYFSYYSALIWKEKKNREIWHKNMLWMAWQREKGSNINQV